jgi:osmotically-inducible protein OsmY
MINRHRAWSLILVVLLAGPSLSGCAKRGNAAGRPRAAAADDAVVTTRVKTIFINDPVVGAARIDVETFEGVVTLSGRVQSKDQEAKAIELARTIRGVKDVKSTLQIQP